MTHVKEECFRQSIETGSRLFFCKSQAWATMFPIFIWAVLGYPFSFYACTRCLWFIKEKPSLLETLKHSVVFLNTWLIPEANTISWNWNERIGCSLSRRGLSKIPFSFFCTIKVRVRLQMRPGKATKLSLHEVFGICFQHLYSGRVKVYA